MVHDELRLAVGIGLPHANGEPSVGDGHDQAVQVDKGMVAEREGCRRAVVDGGHEGRRALAGEVVHREALVPAVAVGAGEGVVEDGLQQCLLIVGIEIRGDGVALRHQSLRVVGVAVHLVVGVDLHQVEATGQAVQGLLHCEGTRGVTRPADAIAQHLAADGGVASGPLPAVATVVELRIGYFHLVTNFYGAIRLVLGRGSRRQAGSQGKA